MISTITTAPTIAAISVANFGILVSPLSGRISQNKLQNIAIGLLLLGLEAVETV